MKNKIIIKNLNWHKGAGLIAAVIVDDSSNEVLMVGWMNKESLKQTMKTGLVTFYSRSRKKIWVKGGSSGNSLTVKSILVDCDRDTLLISAKPAGPVCHTGSSTCFSKSIKVSIERQHSLTFLNNLESVISQRLRLRPKGSYVADLANKGLNRIIQKLGEEAVETVIAAGGKNKKDFENEAADLLFHLLVLLRVKGSSLSEVAAVLSRRAQ